MGFHRIMLMLVLLAAAVSEVSTAVDTVGQQGERVDARVVQLVADAPGRPGYAAMAADPIDLRLLAGWTAARQEGSGGSGSGDDEPAEIEDEPGRVYVVAGGMTGCRLSTGAQLWRDGTDLRVRFTGGRNREECYRPYSGVAQFAVPETAVEGVRTIGGRQPAGAAGPGRLQSMVRLGTVPGDRVPPAPQELGSSAMYDQLARLGVNNLPEAAKALSRKPATGDRAFAFVVPGCAETGAVLLVTPDRMNAELTGGDGTVCDAQVSYLVTFDIAAGQVPPAARLGGR